MGYFSDLDVRVQELGHTPGTMQYDAAAVRLMGEDCRQHRGIRHCVRCAKLWTCDILRKHRVYSDEGERE